MVCSAVARRCNLSLALALAAEACSAVGAAVVAVVGCSAAVVVKVARLAADCLAVEEPQVWPWVAEEGSSEVAPKLKVEEAEACLEEE